MARDDQEDEEPFSDFPSFDDLVEEVGKQDADAMEAARSDPTAQIESTEPWSDGELSDISTPDEGWNWGETGADRSSGSKSDVDALWDESGAAADSEPGEPLDASKVEALIELIGESSSVLLVGPAGIPVEHDICAQLCDVETSGTRRRLLISTSQTADELLESLEPFTDEPFDETIIIVVGDQVRSNNGMEPTTYKLGEQTVSVETLHNPRDLTRMGVLINKYLNDEESPPALCFHSLNDIQQFVGNEKLFRFLHTLGSRVKSVGGRGHYQIDPASLDEPSISTLKPLFDFTVRYDDEAGPISVEPRT